MRERLGEILEGQGRTYASFGGTSETRRETSSTSRRRIGSLSSRRWSVVCFDEALDAAAVAHAAEPDAPAERSKPSRQAPSPARARHGGSIARLGRWRDSVEASMISTRISRGGSRATDAGVEADTN